jgi:hypothetical protein
MRFGEISLEGSGLDALDGKNGQQQRMPAQRIAIRRQHQAAFAGHALGHGRKIGRDFQPALERR